MLEKQILQDYMQAMKARDSVKANTLNFLRSQMKYLAIEKRVESLEDADVIAVIKKQIKQRQDSIEQFNAGGRQDLVTKEEAELAVLKSYLPQEMSADQVEALVKEGIQSTQAASMKDMGKVMKAVAEKAAGRADNKLVSEIVKKMLKAL